MMQQFAERHILVRSNHDIHTTLELCLAVRLRVVAGIAGMTQAQVAAAMGLSQVRVSRIEHGDIEKMQVESIAAYVAAIGGHLRLVADFGSATTFIDYAESRTA
ncbi:MAG TPA: helix-turn-helix transcriptional regulator [Streptosporangiaceae bacterium]